MINTRWWLPAQYISSTSVIHPICIKSQFEIHPSIRVWFIVNTPQIHSKYRVNTSPRFFSGTWLGLFTVVCALFGPTAAQYVRSGAWTVGAPSGCLPRSGFCCKAPNWACWNVHALPAKKHVWCCHAMAAPTYRKLLRTNQEITQNYL